MSVYYKFKSGKEFNSIAIDGHFITVGQLKQKIYETKLFGGLGSSRQRINDCLFVTFAAPQQQKDDQYRLDDATMVPKNASVIISRTSGRPCLNNIVVPRPVESPMEEEKKQYVEEPGPTKTSDESDDFGDDLYAIPKTPPMKSSNPTPDGPSKAEEDSKIRALIETPALAAWQPCGFISAGSGFGRGQYGMNARTPPQGYICRRCKIAGHFIQHCHTNGDPAYDIKRVKPPTGIPKSMLMASEEGSYALPSGEIAVLRPNETAFEKEIKGMPSTRSAAAAAAELPPELHCPLCKQVMKDAVLTGKCCFQSFCDQCIRDFIISRKRCVCDFTNVLADDLVPNKTVRDTINHILESNNNNNNSSRQDTARSVYHVQGESVRPPPKIPSSTLSAASKGQSVPPPRVEEIPKMKDIHVNEGFAAASSAPQQIVDNEMAVKDANWNNVQHGMDPFMSPSSGAMPIPGYMPGTLNMQFPGMMPHGSFAAHGLVNMLHRTYFGVQGHMMPLLPPQRDLAGFELNQSPRPPKRKSYDGCGRDGERDHHFSVSPTTARGYSETNPSKSRTVTAYSHSCPEEEVLKKRKVSSDSAATLLSSSQRHRHRISSRRNTVMLKRAVATM